MVDWESITKEMDLRNEECVAYAASLNYKLKVEQDENACLKGRLDMALAAIRREMIGCVGVGIQALEPGVVDCTKCCGRESCHLYQTYLELVS